MLGGFRLSVDRDEVVLPTGGQRLVALVALRGRVSRSRLAGTLWPDTNEDRAMASLRTGLWRVNRVAGRLIACTAGTVGLGVGVDVDVYPVMRDARAALRAGLSTSVGDIVEKIADIGELLPEWEDEWLIADRERLRQMRLHVLEVAAERLTHSGQHGLALEAAMAALRIDMLRESAHRIVIKIHMAEGNIAEARRAYDRCHQLLLQELGLEPAAATAEILTPTGATTVRGAGVVIAT
jgi:DNA-binding SARP family transcriptional activator